VHAIEGTISRSSEGTNNPFALLEPPIAFMLVHGLILASGEWPYEGAKGRAFNFWSQDSAQDSGSPLRTGKGVQAIFCRRRHQPRRPPLAKIRPGRPAPAMGAGTTDTEPEWVSKRPVENE
jgi:hypothetical protein